MNRTSRGSGKFDGPFRVWRCAARDKRSVDSYPARGRSLRRFAWGAFLPLLLTPGAAVAQVAPDTDWRTLETRRVVTTFPAGQDEIARRAAAIAERALDEIALLLPGAETERVRLLLTSDTDAANGFARVAPYPSVVVHLAPPIDGFALSNFDDWLDLVVTHELVHVLHLDRAGPPGDVLRGIFGRIPSGWPLYPGFAVPGWVIEGLATRYESRITGSGRVRGSDFRAIVRTAALAGRLEGIDAASGDSQAWPAGQRRYVYGALFFDWMAERHGEAALARFVDEVADAWFPWRIDRAGRAAFGESVSEAWSVWREEVAREAEAVAVGRTLPEASGSAIAEGTRYAIHAKARGPWIAWTEVEGTDDPKVRRLGPDGEIREVRVNGVATFDLQPDGRLVVAQRELDGPWRDRTDLFRIDPVTGVSTRLTTGARLDHPSVAPDGSWIAAVRYRGDSSDLVRVDAATGEVWLLADGTAGAFGFPAISPDGRRIAVTRWVGEGTAVELRDASNGRALGTVARGAGLEVAPVWVDDAQLAWGSDADGIPQIVTARLDPAGGVAARAPLTAVATAARFPAVGPDGELLFSVLHADGWELRSRPLETARTGTVAVRSLAPDRTDSTASRARPPVSAVDAPVRGYGVFDTFRPWYWEVVTTEAVSTGGTDVVGGSFGARTRIADQVERHVLDVEASISLAGLPSGSAVYGWSGLGNPTLGLVASQSWDGEGPFRVEREGGAVDALVVRERERRVGVFGTLRRARWRSFAALTLEAGLRSESRELLRAADLEEEAEFSLRRPTARLRDVAVSGVWSTVRGAPVSISAEDGISVGASVRRIVETGLADSLVGVRGVDRSRDVVQAVVRGYRSFDGPGFSDHVVAGRVALGASRGAGSGDSDFDVGGTVGSPEPVTGLELFGEPSTFWVRGFPRGARTGWRAWSVSGEYRLPLALVNRGLGTVPVHLDRLHAALFVDAAGTSRRGGGAGDPIHAAGFELRSEWLALFDTAVSIRTGVAFPTDGSGGRTFYLRFGTAF